MVPLLKNHASEDTGELPGPPGVPQIGLGNSANRNDIQGRAEHTTKVIIFARTGTPPVSLVWSLEPPHALPHGALWSQPPPPPPAQLPHRLVHLADGTLLTGLNPGSRKLNKCPGAFTPPDKDVGRLCLQLRLEAEFQELVTTTMTSKGRRKVQQSGSVSFFEDVRWENLGPFEDGEEEINQDGEAEGVEGRA